MFTMKKSPILFNVIICYQLFLVHYTYVYILVIGIFRFRKSGFYELSDSILRVNKM